MAVNLEQNFMLVGLLEGKEKENQKKKTEEKQPTLLQLSHLYSTPPFFILPPTIGIGFVTLCPPFSSLPSRSSSIPTGPAEPADPDDRTERDESILKTEGADPEIMPTFPVALTPPRGRFRRQSGIASMRM